MDTFKTSHEDKIELNLTEGNIAVISCELPNGNPRPIPLFTFNERPLHIERGSSMTSADQKRNNQRINHCFSSIDRYRISPHGHLHIIDIKASDSGKYQCSAQNSLTGQTVNNSQVTILHVLNKPSNQRERPPLTTVYKPPVASR